MTIAYCESIKWKRGKFMLFGNRMHKLRYSPTLLEIEETCSERITYQGARTEINCNTCTR